MPMGNRELLLAALRNEETERPAWVPFVGVHGAQIIGVDAPSYLRSGELIAKGLTKAAELYRPDGLPVVFDLQVEAEILGCDLNWPADGPPSVTSHPLESGDLEDLPEFDTAGGRFPQIADAMERLSDTVARDVVLYGLVTGPFTLALHLMGNNIFLEMFDRPEHVSKVLDFCSEIGRKTAAFYLEHGASVIAVVDPMTSQISPDHFREFVTPHVDPIFEAVREKGGYSSMFVCGDATRNLEAMAETAADNMSVDENISLEHLQGVASPLGKSIGGNLKLTTVLLLGDEDACRHEAIRCIDTCGTRGFVLAPGCDLPWGVPPENLQAVAEMVHDEYRRDIVRHTAYAADVDAFEDLELPDYEQAGKVYIDVVSLDSATCPPCQYMVEAAERAVEGLDGVVVREHKIKNRQGLGYMTRLGVRSIPTICVDGTPRFASIIPGRNELRQVIEERIAEKSKP